MGTQSKALTASFTTQGPGLISSPTTPNIHEHDLLKKVPGCAFGKILFSLLQGPGFICRRMNGQICDCIHLPGGWRSHFPLEAEHRAGSALELAEVGAWRKETHVVSQEVLGEPDASDMVKTSRAAERWQMDHLTSFNFCFQLASCVALGKSLYLSEPVLSSENEEIQLS